MVFGKKQYDYHYHQKRTFRWMWMAYYSLHERGNMYKIRQWNHCRWRFGICFLELFIEDVRLDRLVLLGWVETTKGKLASFGTGRIMGCVKCVLGICSVFFLKDVNGIARYCCWDMHLDVQSLRGKRQFRQTVLTIYKGCQPFGGGSISIIAH